ncbi:MAG: ATP-binding cassette domain-containing protein, partial [Melioribacter sp.]|nr:ATP-binding cassette domain-containing protein [Melioribacter sp.]
LTVFENVAFGLRKQPASQIKHRVNEMLALVGLTHHSKRMPHELSGGEKQRVAIARAIINEPFLILADEPTGNLDPETADEILSILKKINSRGTTVIFATHNYELIRSFDTKIIKLEDGKAVKVILKKKD